MKMVVLVMMGVVCAAMATGCNKGNNSVDATKPIDKKQEAKQQEHVPSVLMTCVLDAMTAFADGKSTYENPACKVDTNKGTDFYNGRQQELVWIFAKKQDGKTERTITAKFPIKWLFKSKR